MAEREARWNAFQADPEWILKRDRSEDSGPLAAKVFNEFWTPTSYSQVTEVPKSFDFSAAPPAPRVGISITPSWTA